MGYILRRQLRERLGPEVVGLPRLVALEIADDANDHTRVSKASLEDLARWCGAKDTKAVRDALLRLAAREWEFRVEIGKGSDGRPFYAARGHALTFRVPDFTPHGTVPAQKGPNPVGPSESEKGRTQSALNGERAEPSHLKGRTQSPKGPNPVGPLSSGLLSTPHLSLVGVADQIVAEAGVVDAGRERDFIDWINSRHGQPSNQWWRTVARNGDLPHLAARWTADPGAITKTASRPSWCGACDERTRMVEDANGLPSRCPTCNPRHGLDLAT